MADETASGDKITAERRTSKILVDGGDPEETARIKQLLGFVDGQTTNPSLIVKKPRSEAARQLRPHVDGTLPRTHWRPECRRTGLGYM